MGKFDLFRSKHKISEDCAAKFESKFIIEGTSATVIHTLKDEQDRKAALIITDKEGPDTSLVFTYKNEKQPQTELLKGDYFTWKNNTYMVYEDVEIVRDVLYKKQKVYQCNVSFKVNDQSYFGYYVSSLTKYVDTALKGNLIITDNEKPILVIPTFDWVQTGSKIVINGKPFKIIDFDMITNNGICYCSLDVDFISKQEDIVEQKEEENTLKAGIEQTLPINYGFVSFEPTVKVIRKSSKEVTFTVPYGVTELVITTKNMDKIDIKQSYKVVL